MGGSAALEDRIARALVAGINAAERVARCQVLLGREWRWVDGVVRRFEVGFAEVRPRRREVARWLGRDRGFRRALERHAGRSRIGEWSEDPPAMRPVAAAVGWGLPDLRTLGELAAWLRVPVGELHWFTQGWTESACPGLRSASETVAAAGGGGRGHYFYQWVSKRSGGLRLIEEPKARLKTLQRAVLAGLLDRVPVHQAAHGFTRGRSVRTFAAPHVGQGVVLRMDLQDFFPGIRGTRVNGFFRVAGYPEEVADALAGLCLTATPRALLGCDAGLRELYGKRHLAQGAPTSPAMANVLCRRLDARLTGLAEAAGGRYTRYADDLAFSFEGSAGVGRFAAHVGAVALEEGFRVNYRKTRVMRQGVRQVLAGVVVNTRMGTGRAEFDALKALLYNCVRDGGATQNREGRADFRAHLEGRVSWVASVHAGRGAKLQALLEQVVR